MIKIEKIVLFIILLVLFVGAISATENPYEDQSYTNDNTVANDAITVSQDNIEENIINEKKINKKEENLKTASQTHDVSNYAELKNALNSTDEDVTINIKSNITLAASPELNTNIKTLTINGNSYTINGDNKYQFLNIQSSNQMVNINNITITNCHAKEGGAIYNNGGTLNITQSNLTQNTATRQQDGAGGAIYNIDGNLTITHSNLTQNTATGQQDGAGVGGAIYNDGTLNITKSNLTQNTATGQGQYGYGGAIYDASIRILTSITSSNFINNTAPNGAAIYADGNVSFTSNTFKENTATNNTETIDLNGYWNGIHKGNNYESTDIALKEIKLNIKDNQDTFQQGEEVVLNYSIQLTNPTNYWDFETGINDITLYINNEKNKTTRYENITLTDLTPGTYEIYYTTCNRQSNKVTFTVYYPNTECNVTNYTQLVQAIENATNNPYTSYKINLQPGNYNATQSIVWENSATREIIINGNGNALNGINNNIRFITIAEGHNLILNNITIQNYTYTSYQVGFKYWGGAIQNNGTLTITNTIIKNNYVYLISEVFCYGGAIYNTGTLNITHSNLNNNNATFGGAIYNNGGSLNITHSNLNNNNASTGGAIYNTGTLNINNSNLNNNNANAGGAINNHYGTLNINNSNLTYNTATWNAGAINNYYGTLNITHSNLNYNNASTGGAIYSNGGSLDITHSNLNYNNASTGGAIDNQGDSNLNIVVSNINNNNATNGGAIYNYASNVTIYESTLNSNQGLMCGGAIYDYTSSYWDTKIILFNSTFIENKAGNGTVIYNTEEYGKYDITHNLFKNNTASSDKETLNLGQKNSEKIVEENTYDNTDISLKTINLTIKDEKTSYMPDEEIILNYTIELENPDNYDEDLPEKLEDITIYINGEKNRTTKYENTTLTDLTPGKYEVYFTSCNQQSNTVTFKVIGDSQITTPEDSYEYYDGINNKIPLIITDSSGQKGNITITVKDQDEYKLLSAYYNIGNNYQLPTESLASTLKNLYNPLSDSYTINVTYNSDCANPSSTEFTLNITKQRNTTIVYDILNNIEGNVQINITVLDAVYQSPIADATIQITGDINTDTTSGILTDNTLTPGDYTINVEYKETEDYKASQTTIDFTVEIDKDKKIAELEDKIENLTEKLDEAQQTIENLNNNITNLTKQLNQKENQIENLTQQINNLTTQLKQENQKNTNLTGQLQEAQQTIETLNNNLTNLTKQLQEAENKIETLNNTINNLTTQLTNTNQELENKNQEITNLTGQLEQANKQLQTAKDQINNLTKQLTQTQKTIETLNNTIKELTKPPLNTTITIQPIKSSIGSITKITANIKDENGNKVTGGKAIFKINGITLKDETGNTLYAQVKDGIANINYKVQNVWIKNTTYIEAVYSGTTNYTSSRTKQNGILNITKGKANITLNPTTITAKAGQTITLRAKVLDANGDRINNDKVIFKLNGITLKDAQANTIYAQVIDGEAKLVYTLPATYSAKTYTLTAVLGGNYYQRTQTQGTLTIEKKTTTINTENVTSKNNQVTIKATITDENNKKLIKNTPLAIKANGITMLSGVNSTNGTINVSFNHTLKSGLYELLIISGETGLYKSGKTTTILKIE